MKPVTLLTAPPPNRTASKNAQEPTSRFPLFSKLRAVSASE